MRYWDPSITSALAELRGAGAARIVMASLSAFESQVTCEAYRTEALDAAAGMAVTSICEAPALHRARGYRDFFGHACAHALASITAAQPLVVMTAHSLPIADLIEDDPYPGGLREVADAVAAIAGLAEGVEFADDERLAGVTAFGSLNAPVPWLLAYQSRGVRPGEWLGPDLAAVMEVAAATGYDSILVVPIGFAIDHMETLWDLDVDAARRASELGLGFLRTPVPNDSDSLVEALAEGLEPLLQ
jgi:ferrochelatase